MSALEDLKPVLTITGFTCISPMYNYKHKEFEKRIILGVVVVWILLIQCGYSVYDISSENGFIFTINLFVTIFWTTSMCVTVTGSSNWNIRPFQTIFDTFNEIDAYFTTIQNITPPPLKYVLIKLHACNFLMVCIIIYDFYYNFALNFDLDMRYLYPYTFERTGIYLEGMLEYFLLDAIRIRMVAFYTLVEELKSCGGKKKLCDDVKGKVQNLLVLQKRISDTMGSFNKIFGRRVFVMILYILLGLLRNLYYVLNPKYHVGQATYTNTFVSELPFLIQLTVLTVKFEQLMSAGETAVRVCNETLIKHADNPNLANELGVLFYQASATKPALSAGGFFYVNYPMLFMLVNLTATYIIIMIQLLPHAN